MNLEAVGHFFATMKADAASQIMDGVSFLLVTPEFLGEKRLASIRETLLRPLAFIGGLVGFNIDEKNFDSGSIQWRSLRGPFYSAAMNAGMASVLYFVDPFGSANFFGGTFTDLAMIAFVALSLLSSITLVLLLAEKIAVRGFLFWCGAALFFITRAMLFLKAS